MKNLQLCQFAKFFNYSLISSLKVLVKIEEDQRHFIQVLCHAMLGVGLESGLGLENLRGTEMNYHLNHKVHLMKIAS